MKTNLIRYFLFLITLILGCSVPNQAQSPRKGKIEIDEIRLKREPLADTLWRNGQIISIRGLKKVEKTTPEPLIGLDSLNTFISENIQYPQEAIDHNIEGEVMIVLTVNPDSTISIFEIYDLGYGTKEEATRLIKAAGKWRPSINKETGEAISATLLVPIRFELKN